MLCLRGVADRLENILASLIIARQSLAKNEDVHLEGAAVELCESSLDREIVEVRTLADAFAPEPADSAVASPDVLQ